MSLNSGKIFVQLGKGSYVPDEQVTGSALLLLAQNLPGHVKLKIKIEGQEFVRFMVVLRVDDTEKIIPQEETNYFMNQEFTIFESQGLTPGQYNFPFTFKLMPGLPSTMRYQFDYRGNCEAIVSYKLTARLEFHGMNTDVPSHIQEFNVNAPLGHSSQMKKVDNTDPVTHCCCFKKGHTRMVTYFEKDEYEVGETACMIAEIDNSKCDVKIKAVEGVLKQTMKLQAKGYTHYVATPHNRVSFRGLEAGQTAMGPDAIRVQVPLINNKKHYPATCNGRLIQNTYEIKAQSNVDACVCCGDKPQCVIPINLRHPEVYNNVWESQPSNWAPQTMDCFTVQFTQGGSGFPSNPPGMPTMPGPPQMGVPPPNSQPGMPAMPGPPGSQPGMPGASPMGVPPPNNF